MATPIDVGSLIRGAVAESSFIEYECGWNPERILHTICAFANDYEGTYGGYVVIGVSEKDGRPSEVVGVPSESIPGIESELFNLCDLIEPRYVPSFHVADYEGKKIIVIWAYSDLKRPFKCPVKLGSSKKDGSERAYYIRRMSHTVRADVREERTLIEQSRTVSFDEECNPKAVVSDIERDLVTDYLVRAGADPHADASSVDLYDSLRLIDGPPEMRRVVNVALLMFSSDPERFFEGCRVEFVEKPEPDGSDMVETVFRGPVDSQIRRVLQMFRGGVLKERIFKVDDQAEALRIWNYPYAAIEEAVVNAICHKSYLAREPVVITVTRSTVEIGPIRGWIPAYPTMPSAEWISNRTSIGTGGSETCSRS